MNSLKHLSSLILILLISFVYTNAQETTQESISEQDLKKFATVLQEIQMVNQEAQVQMIEAVEDEGLKIERFNEINQARQNEEMEVDASKKELEQFNAAAQELNKIQVAQYQKIADSVQNSPDLQQKLREYLQQG